MELVAVEAVVDARVAVGPLVAVGAEVVEARIVMVGLIVWSTFAVQNGSIFAFPRGFGDGASADVACSVAVLDEDAACALAVLFLISSLFFSSKPASQSNAFAAAIKELRACRGAGTRRLA